MNNQKEIAIIPKGTCISIMGGRITLAEDTKVEGDQASLDYIIKEQDNFDKGTGVVGSVMEDTTYESLSIQGRKEFAENFSISCKNLID